MLVCFVPEIFSYPLSSHTPNKRCQPKGTKTSTESACAGQKHVNRHVELIFCSRFVLKIRFFGVGEFSFNDSPWKAMELHRVFVQKYMQDSLM